MFLIMWRLRSKIMTYELLDELGYPIYVIDITKIGDEKSFC